jgi:DNA-binding SARP family transcriptional activator
MPDFGILGPPLARPIASIIGPDRRREWTILAALTLRPNALMTTAALVDLLWENDPPRTAAKQVLNCVGYLRRALVGSDPAARIGRVGDAHIFRVDPARVDHLLFDRTRLAGDRAVRLGDVPVGITLYRSALDLWRGGAMDGLERSSLAPAAARLNELRTATAESYFDASLAVGEGSRIVAELLQHVGDHPMRERGVGQLMVALHRVGRTHDAYTVFRRLALRLDAELGIAPGPEIDRIVDELRFPAPHPIGRRSMAMAH